MLGEGIETTLSVMQATGLPGWATLSTSGLKAVQVPDEVKITIAADGDEPGLKAANEAAQRLARDEHTVRIATPPEGQDFNDVINGATA